MDVIFVLDVEIRPSSYDPVSLVNELCKMQCPARMLAPGYAGSESREHFEECAREDLEDIAFWKRQPASIVIGLYWWTNLKMLAAIKASGMRVGLWMDSHGTFDPLLTFPASFRAYLTSLQPLAQRLRMIKAALQSIWRRGEIATAHAGKMAQADFLVIESQPAAENLRSFLQPRGLTKLAKQVHVIPHAAKREFTEIPVPLERQNQIAGACRWDDSHKNARGWTRAVAMAAAKAPGWTAVACGALASTGMLTAANCPSIQTTDYMPLSMLAQTFGKSRIYLAASWSESLPIVALEALCMGCTVVAPPITGFKALELERGFGTLARDGSIEGLSSALLEDISAWNAGQRDPLEIAAWWRTRVSLSAVAGQWRDLLHGNAAE